MFWGSIQQHCSQIARYFKSIRCLATRISDLPSSSYVYIFSVSVRFQMKYLYEYCATMKFFVELEMKKEKKQ